MILDMSRKGEKMKLEHLEKELNKQNTLQRTENGALGYSTSGSALLDINYQVSSMRNYTDVEIIELFDKALFANPILAVKWAFFLRDIREGMGERRSFRIILNHLANEFPALARPLISMVAEYGRFDDLWGLLDTPLKEDVLIYVINQLAIDQEHMREEKPVTLLAKWLPSANTSSKESRRYASIIYHGLGCSKKKYRTILKELRKYIDVVESNISRNKWSEVNYETVPSKANLLYRNAFLKHDEERRLEYLQKLSKGEAKINSSVNFPHDVVSRYQKSYYDFYYGNAKYDETLEHLWNNLKDYGDLDEGVIVVRDGSGSMEHCLGNTGVTALDVSTALAIYYSERLTDEFKDKFITFSSHPKIIDLSECEMLFDKLKVCAKHYDMANTDIKAVFDLILDVAVKNNYKQEDLPGNILIISDMEFDYATTGYNQTLFEKIQSEYNKQGYQMPRLIFWNVCGRTNTVPMKENDLGVCLVSGFSPAITDMVMSGELDPYKCLLNKINSPRYDAVEKALREV